MINNRFITIAAVLVSFFLWSQPAVADGKMEFWQTPRKGANYFNVLPEEQWFKAAHDLGIEWVRLAYGKWKGEQRDFLMGNADDFSGVVEEDLAMLVQALDWASKYEIKVVISSFCRTGCRVGQGPDRGIFATIFYMGKRKQDSK